MLCAVCEPNNVVYRTLKQAAPHIRVYKEHREMLDKEELDFIFITTPTFLHVPIALDCVNKGCNFFVEKPIAVNEREAEPLVDALAGHHLVTMVGYMMRYLETFHFAKRLLDDKVLGKVLSFNVTMYVSQLFARGKGWRYNRKESGGGCIITQASHVIDLICWFFGMPRAVNARTISYYSQDVEDFGHAIFTWENGLMGWLDSSWSVDNHRMLETAFTIHGENGTLMVDDDFVKLFLRQEAKGYPCGWTMKSKPELFSGVALDIGVPQFTRQAEDFLKAVRGEKRIESDVASGCRVQRIVDSIYQSALSDGLTVLI